MGVGERFGGADDALPWCLEDPGSMIKTANLLASRLLTQAPRMQVVGASSPVSLNLEYKPPRRAGAPTTMFDKQD